MEQSEPKRSEPVILSWGFVAAWLICLLFYLLQYAMRSAPSVMIPQLSSIFGLSALGISTLVSVFYYSYAVVAIIAGGSIDRWGTKLPITIGILAVALGSVLFPFGALGVTGSGLGRLLQGAGSAFAFTGAVYLAARGFSSRWLATVIGLTQAAGLMGGFIGQFSVGPLIQTIVSWQTFWVYLGGVLAIIAVIFFVVTPANRTPASGSARNMFAPYKIILTNPQSYLCGIIAGLLFAPTEISDMIWGVRFLHTGLDVNTATAVMRSSMVPLGWVVGAPLFGYIADRMGRRKPALFAGIVIMLISGIGILYFERDLPPYLAGLIFGIGSGSAMIPYTMIKEANPDQVKASTAGAMNFLVFSFSAVLGPVFGWALQHFSVADKLTLHTFQDANLILIGAVILAFLLTLALRETGSAQAR
ncbi:MFS transporter [Acidocella sp.]|uniref:MFS transporter n=1 Tax=Acidocella sp. TaxID=50710 RepID=UPI003D031124